jgi:LemA protein
MAVSSQKILNRLYPGANKPAALGPVRPKTILQMVESWARNLGVGGILALGCLTFWMYGMIYYYNVLVSRRAQAMGEWANSEVVMQERHHIIVNLTRVVIDYAQHEREVLTKLTELRTGPSGSPADQAAAEAAKRLQAQGAIDPKTGKPLEGTSLRVPPAPGVPAQLAQPTQIDKLTPKQLEALFSRIQLVAEQYPQLKLTENFKQFSEAIIETEHKIAEHLILYNNAANSYMNIVTMFPGNHYAWIFGFKKIEFYKVLPSELEFKEVDY